MNAMVPLVLGLLLFSAATIAGALAVTRKSRLDLEQRVNQITGTPAPSARAGAADSAAAAWAKAGEKYLRRLFGLGLRHQWGARSPAWQLLLIGLAAAAVLGVVSIGSFGLPTALAVPLSGGMFILAPRMVIQAQQSRAERKFLTLFPDALDMGIRMLRAGLPVTAAIRTIGNEGPSPINGVFSTIADRIEIGIPLEEALRSTGAELGIADFRFFAMVVALQRATGGNLAVSLDILAEIMRKRRAMRLKAIATTSEVRVSAYILGSLPFLVVGALLLVSPGYLAPLLTDPRGNLIAGLSIVSLALGFFTMRRLARSATGA